MMMRDFWGQLFQTSKQRTWGELWHFKLLEIFIVGYTIKYAWEWAFYIPRNSEIVLPLGIANYIDISFMFDEIWAIGNAVLISLLCVFAFFRMRFKWQYLLALVLLHVQFAVRFSQDPPQHGLE